MHDLWKIWLHSCILTKWDAYLGSNSFNASGVSYPTWFTTSSQGYSYSLLTFGDGNLSSLKIFGEG